MSRRDEVMAGQGMMRVSEPGAAVGWSSVRWLGSVGLLAGAFALLVSCQNEECEASRLQLAQTWETLRNTASSRKQIPESSDLSKSEEAERIRVWSAIEERAELVRSSFETTQVTWSSADKARADLLESFKPISSSDDPMTRGFAVTLEQADQRMARFRNECR